MRPDVEHLRSDARGLPRGAPVVVDRGSAMRLLIVRHADAGDAEQFARTGKPDHLRPLSDEGRETMLSVALGLREVVPKIDRVVTSPYVRAVETAAILCAAYKITDAPVETRTLEPNALPADFAAWLAKQRDAKLIAAAGHEPNLSFLTTWLMTGAAESRVRLKKAGACLLEFEGAPRKGEGVLLWLHTAEQLARLGRAK